MNRLLPSYGFLGGVALALLLASCTVAKSDKSPTPSSTSTSSSGSGSNGSTGPAPGGNLNAKPVIDDLVLPESVNATGAYYFIQGTISFHDDVGVTAVHVRVPAIGKTAVIPANGEQQVENEPLAIQLSADIPLGGAGPTELDVSVVDTAGLESDARRVTVVLQ